MSKQVFIYTLVDPNTQKTRYVGQTVNPDKRLSEHLYTPSYKLKHGCRFYREKNVWLANLISRGQRPVFKVLCCCGKGTANTLEKALITSFFDLGYELLNSKVGV